MIYKITDIASNDSYYTKRDELIGQTGELIKVVGSKNAEYKFCEFRLNGRDVIFRGVKLEKI